MRGPASAAAPTVFTNCLRKRPRVFSSDMEALLVDIGAILRTRRERATGKTGGMRRHHAPPPGALPAAHTRSTAATPRHTTWLTSCQDSIFVQQFRRTTRRVPRPGDRERGP